MSRKEIHQEFLWTLFSSCPFLSRISCDHPFVIPSAPWQFLSCSAHLLHRPTNFVFFLNIEWPIFLHTPSKITQAKHCFGSFYCISQLFCCRLTKLIYVWPCSGYRLWPYIVCHVFLLLTMIFPGQTTDIKLVRDSLGTVHKSLVHGVSQQMVVC